MNRNKTIDIMKALGIFCVVLGHIIPSNGIIERMIYIFHMPLFFILSGYLIKYEKQCNQIEYIKKKIKGIMCPYFVFSIISFLYWLFIERKFRGGFETLNDTNLFINIFLNIFIMKADTNLLLPNIVLWFLPCFFFANLLFYYIKRINNRYKRILISFLLFILGYILKLNYIILPFTIENVLIFILFVDFGYEIANINLKNKNVKIFTISIVLYLSAVIFNTYFEFSTCIYNDPLFIFGAIGGTGVVYIISLGLEKLKKISNIIQYIGINSMTIMLVSEPFKRIVIFGVSKILNIEDIALRGNIGLCLIVAVLTIIIILPFTVIINKYFPWMVGRKNKNKLLRGD